MRTGRKEGRPERAVFSFTPLVVAVSLSSMSIVASLPAQTPPPPEEGGSWEGPYYLFGNPPSVTNEIAHAALIGAGPNTGKVVFWRSGSYDTYIWDPAAPTSAQNAGTPTDILFCAGQCWDASGKLVVGGGDLKSPVSCTDEPNWSWVYDPVTPSWSKKPDMLQLPGNCGLTPPPNETGHYYPSLIALPDEQTLSVGGSTSPGTPACPRSNSCRSNEWQIFDGSTWTGSSGVPFSGVQTGYGAVTGSPSTVLVV